MALRRFYRLRRLQTYFKILLILLSAYSILFFLYTLSKLQKNLTVRNGVQLFNETPQMINASESIATVSALDGFLNVYIWRKLCGDSVENLKKLPFFPQHPDEEKVSDVLHIEDNTEDYGQRIFGFIHPPQSVPYLFGIASDDSSELWLSPSEDPRDKQLIARVFDGQSTASTKVGHLEKYRDQVSKTPFKLERGKKYYIEVLHKQIKGAGFVQVYWRTSNDLNFKVISADHISTYTKAPAVTRKESIPAVRLQNSLQIKSANGTKRDYFKFYSLPFIPTEKFLPSCDYKTTRQKVTRFQGIKWIVNSHVFPEDDTTMGLDDGDIWTRPNLRVDEDLIESVVDKIMSSIERLNSEYYLKRIHQVKLKPGLLYGDRYLVDLELGIKHKKGSYRFSEHVYQKKGSSRLCFPKGLTWNKAATVYFVVPVKDQGEWVYHFINEITAASLLTKDENFHVIVVDFESQDISISQAFDTDLLRNRHTIINMTGKFYKTLALNKAVEHIPSEHDLLFLFDLHIDVPADIMDSVRKNTIKGHIVFCPQVGRLNCGSSSVDHKGYWELEGYGLVGVYKSDWIRFGGMNTEKFKYNWGGEDWDLLDRIINLSLEVERIKYPGLYHHYHTKKKKWG
ncbi:N-acetyl-beta-glucosaminyl-glycoprotein 4-beta-N-acetylgalactosaminyltransferase 1-like [Acropora millepora]|uniref:N-acetyl-beta-glucosaminyl-glycoprotein 4-beta-N-acetylgalactosaminyltransferase 1-like n=1 Tax=Acropora millepora TaxID=45264 RepID=UPI001CF4CDF0|nr:N-acetyl-beta-glucosaminyl-glycoprotein 4-beta-N-acetylgalactosaminyltransferase 1-like [Acropora millepora]